MKEFLRKWLEVPEVLDMSGYVKKDDIKEVAEDAIAEAFSPGVDYFSIGPMYWLRDQHKDISGVLDKSVSRLAGSYASIAVNKKISEIINQESFIDDVVERIRSKQLRN